MPEIVDQAGILGDRDEVRGRDGPALGMAPAQQRLAAADPAVLEVKQRLIVQLEAAVDDGLAQLQLQTAPRLGARVHAGLEEPVGAAAVALRAIEREVGVAQQLIEVEPIGRRNRDADAGVGRDQVPAAIDRLANALVDRGQQLHGLGLITDRGLDHGKLVAAEPRCDIGFPEAGAQTIGDGPEQFRRRSDGRARR